MVRRKVEGKGRDGGRYLLTRGITCRGRAWQMTHVADNTDGPGVGDFRSNSLCLSLLRCLSAFVSGCVSFSLLVCLSFCLPVSVCVCVSACPASLSLSLSVSVSVCLSFYLSVYLLLRPPLSVLSAPHHPPSIHSSLARDATHYTNLPSYGPW